MCRAVTDLKGNLETIYWGDGFALITGWLLVEDRNVFPTDAVLTIWDGTEAPIRGSFFRQDLHDAGFGDCAFKVCVQTPVRPGHGALLMVTAGAGHLTLVRRLSPQQIHPFRPVGSIEHVSLHGAWGWIYDPGLWPDRLSPILRVDGAIDIPLPVDVIRPDLPFDVSASRPLGFGLPLRLLLTAIEAAAPRQFLLDGGPHHYELLSSGHGVSARDVDLGCRVSGRMEAITRGAITGWAIAEDNPEIALDVEILADGIGVATVSANLPRADLRREGIAETSGGFRLPASHIMGGAGQARLSARPLGSARLLKGAVEVELSPLAPRADLVPLLMPPTRTRGVAIVVPIYNAAEDLALCLASLVTWTTLPARLILIDDASPDAAVAAILDRYEGRPNIEIHRVAQNRGFVRTANHGIALAGADDVVLLNSDAVVGPRWLEGLRAAAYSQPRHGTATPMSNNAGEFSFPIAGLNNALASGDIAIAARLAAQGAGPFYPTVPTGHGFCLYLRRDCLDEVGLLDAVAFPRGYGEENDFSFRAARLGWTHVLDDRTLVFHKRSASFKDEQTRLMRTARDTLEGRYPEYTPLVEGMKTDPLIEAVRGRVGAGATRLGQRTTVRPRILFVVSTETGGTPQTNRDLMRSLRDRYEGWLLRSDAERLYLYGEGSDWRDAVETHQLSQPIQMANHRSTEYDAIVAGILIRRAIELVHVRHLAWHGLDLPLVARRLCVPVVMSFHDFYTLCPTTKLLDEKRRFCGGTCTPGNGFCQAELWRPGAVPHLKHGFVHVWRQRMAGSVEACDAYVTTSGSAARVIAAGFPATVAQGEATRGEAAARGIDIIPHGRSFPAMTEAASAPATGEPLRVLLPGNLSPAKGSELVVALAEAAGPAVEFHILGDPGIVKAAPNVILHGRYERDELVDRVAAIRPHLGAIFSIWAETWSHTLTEMWACGLPVLALDIGAVAERIAARGGGWLLPVDSTPAAILKKLQSIRRQAKVRAVAVAEVAAWQAGEGRFYDTVAMAARYDAVYRRVIAARRVFATPAPIPLVLVLGRRDEAEPEAEARVANDADRPIVFWHPADAGALASLGALPVAAVLVRGRIDLDALRVEAKARGIPILPEDDLLTDGLGRVVDFDRALLAAMGV
jgi:GT2 family glycosyltransferase/glycosyltransferase involved in cell wall biosynthesis